MVAERGGSFAGVGQQGLAKLWIDPCARNDTRADVRADLGFIGFDDGIQGRGIRVALLYQDSLNGANPQFCQVDGHVATPGNEVNFRLGLPERWNGKYYFVGVGGTGGTIGRLDAGLASRTTGSECGAQSRLM